MEKITSRSVEVGAISGEGLTLGTRPLKNTAFVVLKTDDCSESRECATSKMAGASHGVILWNCEKLCVDLPYSTRFLMVEVYTRGGFVGSARIPVSDFVRGYVPENHLQFLSYRLRDGYGIKNGIVNISVKVKRPAGEMKMPPLALQPEIGFPIGNRMAGDGVVVGVPVVHARSRVHPPHCTDVFS